MANLHFAEKFRLDEEEPCFGVEVGSALIAVPFLFSSENSLAPFAREQNALLLLPVLDRFQEGQTHTDPPELFWLTAGFLSSVSSGLERSRLLFKARGSYSAVWLKYL